MIKHLGISFLKLGIWNSESNYESPRNIFQFYNLFKKRVYLEGLRHLVWKLFLKSSNPSLIRKPVQNWEKLFDGEILRIRRMLSQLQLFRGWSSIYIIITLLFHINMNFYYFVVIQNEEKNIYIYCSSIIYYFFILIIIYSNFLRPN